MGSLCCRRAIIQAPFACAEPEELPRSAVVILSDAGLACDEPSPHSGLLGVVGEGCAEIVRTLRVPSISSLVEEGHESSLYL